MYPELQAITSGTELVLRVKEISDHRPIVFPLLHQHVKFIISAILNIRIMRAQYNQNSSINAYFKGI